MLLNIEERPSDSPFAERIYRSYSEKSGNFISMAQPNWTMVVTRLQGKTYMTVRGPETRATQAFCPPEGDWVGILFKAGTIMPHLPASRLVDGQADLPEAGSRAFWLQGAAWEYPDYENADTFVDRLVRQGLLVREPTVEAALQGQVEDLSLRTAQRRFLRATGLTHNAMRQIRRARHATILLRQGVSIFDTIDETGYFDQPHLTKTLKHLIGQTPAQLLDESRVEQLSFIYKTEPFS